MPKKNIFTQEIDRAIGIKIHELRLSNGYSRMQLAEKIGVTHQQLQKYEKGVNRISAGRLAIVAKELKKPVSFFLAEVEDGDEILPTQHQRMCIEVSRNFLKVKDPMVQNAVNLLLRTLADSSYYVNADDIADKNSKAGG